MTDEQFATIFMSIIRMNAALKNAGLQAAVSIDVPMDTYTALLAHSSVSFDGYGKRDTAQQPCAELAGVKVSVSR